MPLEIDLCQKRVQEVNLLLLIRVEPVTKYDLMIVDSLHEYLILSIILMIKVDYLGPLTHL